MATYTSLRVRADTADRARRLSRVLAIQADRNVSLVDAVNIAIEYTLLSLDRGDSVMQDITTPDAQAPTTPDNQQSGAPDE
jgi:hypothetical protein